MCGRFTQERPASELAEIFGAEPLVDDPGGHYNVAPTDEAAVVVQRDDRRAITAYRWGLIPHWATEAKVASRMFNARAETLTTSPAFRAAFQRRAASCRSIRSTNGSGRARSASHIAWSAATAAPGARGPLGGLARPRDRDRAADLHDRDNHPERRAARPARPDAGRAPRRCVGPWLGPPPRTQVSCSGCSSRTKRSSSTIYPVVRDVNDVRRDGPALIEPLVPAASSTPVGRRRLDQSPAAVMSLEGRRPSTPRSSAAA